MASFGFIGTGNMGGALAGAVCKATDPKNVILANRTREKAEKLAAALGCKVGTNEEAIGQKFVFLGVKPNMMEGLLAGLKDLVTEDTVLVSMAAALSLEKLSGFVGKKCKIIRIMPNTPVSVGAGVITYAANENVTKEEILTLTEALKEAGKCMEIAEKLIDAGSAVAGCGPAYCQMFIEALADGGVACGLSRSQALEMAAMMVMGSAKMTLETGKNPGLLKDEVCSPGGSTIQGVRALEARGFRSAAFEAVVAAYEKTLDMGK